MPKYRKKLSIIGAVQITDKWFDGDHPNPLHPIGTLEHPVKILPQLRMVEIYTFEGVRYGCVDDWLITDVQGEMYFFKSDIFEAIYELVEE